MEDCGWVVQLLDCSSEHYPEYSVALDSAFVVAFFVAFAVDPVEVDLEIVVGLAEAGPGIVVESAEAGSEIVAESAEAVHGIVAEPAVAAGTVAEPGNAAAVLALDTVAAALGIDVAVESDRDNVVVAEADGIVAAALVPGIVVAHGLSVVAAVSVLDIVAAKDVSVADDTAGIGAVAGIAVETAKYNKKCVKKRWLLI